MVSNGAYYLKAFHQGDYTLLEKDPNYWDAEHVAGSRVKVVTRTDPAASLVEFENGSLDVLTTVPMQFAPELLLEKRDDVHLQPVFGTYYYVFNCTRPPLNDARVRMTLGWPGGGQAVYCGEGDALLQRPANGLTPVGSIPGYDTPHGQDRDVARARKLLAEAGFPDGKGMRPIELLYNTGGDAFSGGPGGGTDVGAGAEYSGGAEGGGS